MKKTILIALGALGLVVAAGAAYAAMGHRGGFRMMKHMISARIEDAEDLIEATPQQRQVIEEAKQAVFQALEQRFKDKRGQAGQIIDLLAADRLDTQKLYQLADQRAQEIRDMANVIIPQIQKVHDVLTPAQRQKLADYARTRHFHGPPHHDDQQ